VTTTRAGTGLDARTIDLFPFEDKPWRMTMGLRPLDLDDWLWPGADRLEQMVEKDRLLAAHPDEVLGWLDGAPTTEACEELLDLVARSVGADPAWTRHPIDTAGRLVQEDLCVLEPSPAGYVLTAANVCFPSRWRLADKLGHPLRSIHAPVPAFAATIGAPTDATFARLRVDKPVWRLNWSLLDDPALFQPTGRRDIPGAPEHVGADVVLRVERQTLRRLPMTQAVVFTIRTIVATLDAAIGTDRQRATAMAATLRSMPPEMLAYKAIGGSWLEAVLRWLDARSGGVQTS
jgi:hypothetical protein